ncbi:succinyldiaminopimelate transaminase [Helicobacter cappadocius]|uniref:Succinyldiaminopimelate transaminase n=1 Tax=Helicobacter cappadocius TaxID=3063998 RepID=A0AA90PRP8_9HELI|nr:MULTISPECIES: succinyldiaminopimelate transaminase [unclassified Helicobacter]MDO7252799.1 succinyldiaminopimelate transaminase [Helicobacter sp. faydin-H75]MDP2538842.1 succinyldiaminopimelate transaminase [Helicobacter sp. faydin-H76]
MNFQPYPFERLRDLIAPIVPKKKQMLLTIGEPQFQTPSFIQEELKNYTSELRFYPKSAGEDYLKKAQMDFVKNRFKVSLESSEIIPTFGTREVLFNLPQFLLFDKLNPVIAHPNPFYQIYEGAGIAARAKIIYMDLCKSNHFKPFLSDEDKKEVDLVILNSPNNPTGATLSLDELKNWVQWALEYDFVLLNDECYSDIYKSSPPAGILEASYMLGNKDFKNVLSLNSISKRSSAPGLRSGFIAGDKNILREYQKYRTYIGCAIPNPIQRASAVAWEDIQVSEKIRQKYAKNFQIAQEIFPNVPIEPYTFYMWLEVRDDVDFTKKLYEKEGLLVLPGSFLGRKGVGKEYVRIALVYEEEITRDCLKILKGFLCDYLKKGFDA